MRGMGMLPIFLFLKLGKVVSITGLKDISAKDFLFSHTFISYLVYYWLHSSEVFTMAKVTEESLIHLAKLCRIGCSDKEREALLKDFRQIVEYVEQLSKINTEGIEPCSCVTRGHAQTPLREDIPENTLDRDLFLKGAPSSIAGLVRVPTVLKSKEG